MKVTWALIIVFIIFIMVVAYKVGKAKAVRYTEAEAEEIEKERMGAIQKRRDALDFLRNEGEQLKNADFYNGNALCRDYGLDDWEKYYSHVKEKRVPFRPEWIGTDFTEIEKLKERAKEINDIYSDLMALRTLRGYHGLKWEWHLNHFCKRVDSLGLSLEFFGTNEQELEALICERKFQAAQRELCYFQGKIAEACEHLDKMNELLDASGRNKPDMEFSSDDENLELQIRKYLKFSKNHIAPPDSNW